MKKNVIKLISILMALGMLFAVIPCGVVTYAEGAGTVFTDVAADDWFYGDVEYVNEKGLMKGVAEKTFAPDAPLSRAMCATILYRMAGEPEVDDVKLSFADVPEDTWYTDAVKWAYCEEIVNGRAQNTFAPEDNITRAELATMLFRYANHKFLGLPENRENSAFADAKNIPEYAEIPVSLLYCSEVINGKGANRFAPQDNTTRAEAAAMLHRFAENTVESDMWLLEKYGLAMSVYAAENNMPTTDFLIKKAILSVRFRKDVPENFETTNMSVAVKLNNQNVILENDGRDSFVNSAQTMIFFKEGQLLKLEITVAIGDESAVFYSNVIVDSVY